jgi:hypothetical protein
MDRTQTRNMQPELNEPNDLLDHDDAPIIDGLPSSSDTRTPSGQESKPISTEALRKIKTQRETIRTTNCPQRHSTQVNNKLSTSMTRYRLHLPRRRPNALWKHPDRTAFRNGLSARKTSPNKKDCNNKVNENKHNKSTPSTIPLNLR